jgi:hypothetical protein
MLVFVSMVGVGVTAAVTAALVPVLTGLVERQHAQSAADAAALAGVTGGRAASLSIAAANEAAVIAWSRAGHEVTVTVEVGDRGATGRATDAP